MPRRAPPARHQVSHLWHGNRESFQHMKWRAFGKSRKEDELEAEERVRHPPEAMAIPERWHPGDPPVMVTYTVPSYRPATDIERILRRAGAPHPISIEQDGGIVALHDDLDVKRKALGRRRRERRKRT